LSLPNLQFLYTKNDIKNETGQQVKKIGEFGIEAVGISYKTEASPPYVLGQGKQQVFLQY